MKHFVLSAILVACGGNRVEDSGAAQAAPAPSSKSTTTPATTPPPPTTPAKAAPMTTFMPTIKFREYAAKVLGIPASEVEGGPKDATDAADAGRPYTIGKAWGVIVHPKDNQQREVRGWVTADGTVITAEQNLGLLLAEVGVWTKDRKQKDHEIARKAAELLKWSYGYGYSLVMDRDFGMTPPTLTLKSDGSGELVFFTDYKSPGPGGAGGGPADFTEHRVAFKADKSTTLTKKKVSLTAP